MGSTTKGTQAASQDAVRRQQPNQPGAGGSAPAPPSNAFRGRPERLPQRAYVSTQGEPQFLNSARDFYRFFSVPVVDVASIEDLVADLGARPGIFERLLLVSHAHPLGMIVPMFRGGVPGTNSEVFAAFAVDNLEGLKALAPFDLSHKHVIEWGDSHILASALDAARSRPNAATVLGPFGLGSGTPSGLVRDFLFYCLDIVYMLDGGDLRPNSGNGQLGSQQRQQLAAFVRAILVELGRKIAGGTISGHQPSESEIANLQAHLTGIRRSELRILNARFDIQLVPGNMNDFPTLVAAVRAMRDDFRGKVTAARQRVDRGTILDIRGCRAGEHPEYVESVRQFFGRPNEQPTVSAPRLFQSYRSLAFEPINNRAHARTWLGATRWQHPPAELRDRMQTWAGLIRVEPLHTEFWGHLFDGPAAAFAELGWRSRVPPLFIPTPGLAALAPLPLSGVVGRLADMFDVPNGSVPSAGELTTALATMTSMAPHVAILLANVPDGTPAPRLAAIHQALDAIDAALGQTLVPAPPSPPGLTVATVRGWRQAILDHLDAGPLERLKSFMSAAAASLRTGDGLQFYLLFAGLPVFVFGRPQMPRNGIVYHRDHAAAALQSWYRCLWADPLPAAGPHTTATFSGNEARLAPLLVDTDRHSIASICPLPRYGDCMRRRPLPSNEADPDCESSTEP